MKELNYALQTLQNDGTRPRLQSRTQNMFCYLDFRCYFEANGENHIHFRLIQVLKNSMAWHFLTFVIICISPVLRGRRANAHLLVKFNAWTSQRLLIWNPFPKLTIVLIWETRAYLKFVKTSNRAVENLPQRKLCVWAANDARSSSCLHLSYPCRNAVW